MGRAYTEDEREKLRIKIKEIASTMFMQQGFKDFRIMELTKQVGISLGGFYTFYKDKEALYEEILRDEKNRIRKKILTIIEEENLTPKDFFTDLCTVLLDKSNSNKFYTNEYSSLFKTMVWNDDALTAEDNLYFIQQIRKIWTKKGMLIAVSDEELTSAVATLAILCTNKDKIGAGFDTWYQAIENLLLSYF